MEPLYSLIIHFVLCKYKAPVKFLMVFLGLYEIANSKTYPDKFIILLTTSP